MSNFVYELLFCPVHGLLRAEIISYLPAIAGSAIFIVKKCLKRNK